jgi:DNA-nicking Smr family endonuclease
MVKNPPTKTLDLHGIKHVEVSKLVDQFIWENMKSKSQEVEIITGISDQMKLIVINTINDYGFSYIEEFNNPGKLIVKLI